MRRPPTCTPRGCPPAFVTNTCGCICACRSFFPAVVTARQEAEEAEASAACEEKGADNVSVSTPSGSVSEEDGSESLGWMKQAARYLFRWSQNGEDGSIFN